MRILWLSHNVPFPPIGGVLQRNFHLVRQASERGAEIHLVALRQRALCPDEPALAAARNALSGLCRTVHVFELDWEICLGARVGLAISVLAGRPYDAARYSSRACHQFLMDLQHPGLDIIHVDSLGLMPYVKHLPELPVVLNHHNVESSMMGRRARGEPRVVVRAFLRYQAARLRAWERHHAPRCAGNLVVSELDKSRLARIAPGARAAVVPNGVDCAYFDAASNEDPRCRSVVFVGSQAWYPNRDAVEFLLDEIWPRVREREGQAELLLIGRNPCQRAIRAAARDSSICVLGFVDDIRPKVAAAAVYVCPFRQGGGTRLKLLDALAMRKAVVSTSLGAEGVPVEHGVSFLCADDPQEFAEHVVNLFRDAALRRRLGEAGRSVAVSRFDWGVVGARLFQAYEQFLRDPY